MNQPKQTVVPRDIFNELWNFVSITLGQDTKELSFALINGDKRYFSNLRNSLESKGQHLAAFGLDAMRVSIISRLRDTKEVSTSITRSKVLQDNVTSGIQVASASSKKKTSCNLSTGRSGQQNSRKPVQRRPSSVGDAKVPVSISKKLIKTLLMIRSELAGTGLNKSLHKTCAICDFFKNKAPKNGLFKSSQYKAIIDCHDSTISVSNRVKQLKLQFGKATEKPASNSQTGIVAANQQQRSDTSASCEMDVCESRNTVKNGEVRSTKAKRRSERESRLDANSIEQQVLDEKIRIEKSKLSETCRFDPVLKKVNVPEQGLALTHLLKRKRELVKEKKSILSHSTSVKKKKR